MKTITSTVPIVRFKEFTESWKKRKIGDFLTTSRISGHTGLAAKKLTVKLWGKGIVEKSDAYQGSENTQYYIRHTGQFIYGKLDFLHAAFGIVPEKYDGYESTIDSPAFDIRGMNEKFLLNRVGQTNFYLRYGNMANGSRKAMRIHEETFLDMPIVVPSLKEQSLIGCYITCIDKLITLYQSKMEQQKKLKKYFLQNMFPAKGEKVPKIRLKGFYGNWELKRFSDVGTIAMCKRIFKDETSENGEIPFFKIGTFGKEPDAYISRRLFDEYKSKYSYPKVGDILVSASGTIGRQVEYKGEDAYYQDSNIIWLQHDKSIDNKFLKVLYEIVKWDGIEGSTIKRLYNDNFLKTKFYLPSLDEQKKIGEYFISFDRLINYYQYKFDKLQTLKKYMLQNMFV